MEQDYCNIKNAWYNGKNSDYIYSMIINWFVKYPESNKIEELKDIYNRIVDGYDYCDSIDDIIEDFINININH